MDAEESLLPAEERQRLPHDRYHLVYVIFTLQGLSMLLPWNGMSCFPLSLASSSSFLELLSY